LLPLKICFLFLNGMIFVDTASDSGLSRCKRAHGLLAAEVLLSNIVQKKMWQRFHVNKIREGGATLKSCTNLKVLHAASRHHCPIPCQNRLRIFF